MSDISKLGSILGIWAHPDDETFSSAGIMTQAADNKQRVAIINASHGEAGKWDSERFPGSSAKEVRLRELINALHIIGVTERHNLGCKDGELDSYDRESMVTRITKIIDDFKPDTILTFGPDGITGHSDHRTIHTWATKAAHRANSNPLVLCTVQDQNSYNDHTRELDKEHNLYFAIDHPVLYKDNEIDHLFHLPRTITNRKYAALKAHASQTTDMIQGMGEENFKRMIRRETFVNLNKVKPFL